MADIVLAEHQRRAWLVNGEPNIDDLLANTLPSDISIEFAAYGSHADVISVLVQNPSDGALSFGPQALFGRSGQPADQVRHCPPCFFDLGVSGLW